MLSFILFVFFFFFCFAKPINTNTTSCNGPISLRFLLLFLLLPPPLVPSLVLSFVPALVPHYHASACLCCWLRRRACTLPTVDTFRTHHETPHHYAHDCHQPRCEQPRHQFSQLASHNAANTCKRDVLQRYIDDDRLARSLVPYRFFSLLKEIANIVAPFLPVQSMAFATLTPVIQGLHVLPRFAVAWGFLVV